MILWFGLGLSVLVIACVAWVGVRAVLAKAELEAAIPLAARIQSQVISGDAAGAGRTFKDLSTHSSNAAELTSDPIWRSFEIVPSLGPNLTAVRELASVVDDVSRNAVGPLTKVAGGISFADFKPVGGSLDVQPLIDAQPKISMSSAALTAARRRVARIDVSETVSAVASAVGRLDKSVAQAAESVSVLDRAVRLVPSMLGASGPRDYVLLFQNPAELRASGGIAGAVALIHTENGRIKLTHQAAASSFPRYERPVLKLPTETRGIYGNITGQYMQDVNLTPNFPLSAQLAREMGSRQFGVKADGVLSIDPIALSYLLKATGPITLPTGDVLSADNAVKLLLSDVYARYDNPADQDKFFAAAAASVFSAISSGKANPVALIEALAKAGTERRVSAWSAHIEDQAVLSGTTLAGGLPLSDKKAKRFGVYLNDATGAKMGTYLAVKVGIGQAVCRRDKRPSYGVEVTLTNTAHGDAGKALPEYVTGGGNFGVKPGNVKTVIAVYGAPGMQDLGMTRDGKSVGYHPATDSGHPVSSFAVELAPGEKTVLHFNWLGAEQFSGELAAQTTPGIYRNETQRMKVSCEPLIG